MSSVGKKGKSHVSFRGYLDPNSAYRGQHSRLSVSGPSSRSSSRLGSALSRSVIAGSEDTSLLVLEESEQEYM